MWLTLNELLNNRTLSEFVRPILSAVTNGRDKHISQVHRSSTVYTARFLLNILCK